MLFSDPLALTFFDADHSADEDRYLTIGFASFGTKVVVVHTDMLPEYDFASMGTPERGKHFAKYQR